MELSPYHVNEDGGVQENESGWWKRRLWYWHDINEHWNYPEDALAAVEVYANCEEVELLLNGRSLGTQLLEDQEDRVFKWAVPFETGQLEARGRNTDGKIALSSLITAGEPASILLAADRATLAADGYEVAHLVAQLVDVDGQPVRHIERELEFSVSGPCRSLGVDNGAIDSVQSYQSDRLMTNRGRALPILQSEREPGVISVRAESGHLHSSPVGIDIS